VRGAFDKLQYRQQIWHRLGEQHSAAVAKWQYFNYQQLQQVSKERERERERKKGMTCVAIFSQSIKTFLLNQKPLKVALL
jgi:hypothetical protein